MSGVVYVQDVVGLLVGLDDAPVGVEDVEDMMGLLDHLEAVVAIEEVVRVYVMGNLVVGLEILLVHIEIALDVGDMEIWLACLLSLDALAINIAKLGGKGWTWKTRIWA